MITIFGDYSGGAGNCIRAAKSRTPVSGSSSGPRWICAQTKFFNAEEGGCELLGRGGMWF